MLAFKIVYGALKIAHYRNQYFPSPFFSLAYMPCCVSFIFNCCVCVPPSCTERQERQLEKL